MLKVYEADDATLVEDLPIPDFEAGEDSGSNEVHIWNPAGEQDLSNILGLQRTAHLTAPNVWLASGVPPQDELWGRIRIIGYDNSGDPTWSIPNSDWYPLGAFAGLPIATIPAGCAVYAEYLWHAPRGASPLDYRFKLVWAYAEYSLAQQLGLTALRRGILAGIGDFTRSGLISGLGVTVNSPADDKINLAPGFGQHRGIPYGDVAREQQFDNLDSAAEALEAGEHYWVAHSRGVGGARTFTKGPRGAAAAKPAVPAGEDLVEYIRIDYQLADTPVIEAADLEGETLYDRYLAVPGSGPELIIHPGWALGGSTLRVRFIKHVLPLTDDAVNHVWQLPAGLWTATTTDTPPSLAATGPWWRATMAGGVLTLLEDLRTYADPYVVLHLRGNLPGGPGEIASQLIDHDLLYCEAITYRLSDAGEGATAGQTQLDSRRDGTTLYTDHAVDDQRPAVDWDAAGDDLVVRGAVHQETALRRGQVLSLHLLERPADGAPQWAEAYYYCRVA